MWRAVFDELAWPDDQRDDWFGWAAAQMAHGLIGAALVGALALIFGVGAWWAAGIVAAGYAAIKEGPDIWRGRTWRVLRDSIHDALFVAGGAIMAASLLRAEPWAFGAAVSAIIYGLAWGVAVRMAIGRRGDVA